MPKASQVEGRFDSLALKHLSHFLPHVYNAQSLSRLRLFAAPRTAARQASLSITNSRSLLKLMSLESVIQGAVSRCRNIQSTTEKMIINSIHLLFSH